MDFGFNLMNTWVFGWTFWKVSLVKIIFFSIIDKMERKIDRFELDCLNGRVARCILAVASVHSVSLGMRVNLSFVISHACLTDLRAFAADTS